MDPIELTLFVGPRQRLGARYPLQIQCLDGLRSPLFVIFLIILIHHVSIRALALLFYSKNDLVVPLLHAFGRLVFVNSGAFLAGGGTSFVIVVLVHILVNIEFMRFSHGLRSQDGGVLRRHGRQLGMRVFDDRHNMGLLCVRVVAI